MGRLQKITNYKNKGSRFFSRRHFFRDYNFVTFLYRHL